MTTLRAAKFGTSLNSNTEPNRMVLSEQSESKGFNDVDLYN
jgi:hypothetical protein